MQKIGWTLAALAGLSWPIAACSGAKVTPVAPGAGTGGTAGAGGAAGTYKDP